MIIKKEDFVPKRNFIAIRGSAQFTCTKEDALKLMKASIELNPIDNLLLEIGIEGEVRVVNFSSSAAEEKDMVIANITYTMDWDITKKLTIE